MTEKYTEAAQIDLMREELDKAISSPKKPNTKKIIGMAVFYVVVIFLVYAFLDVTIDKRSGRVPELLGVSFYEIVSDSMEPTLKVGSILVTKAMGEGTKLGAGDVVTFEMTDGRIVTHRIVEVLNKGQPDECYRTKGDNPVNSVDAEVLTRDRILAVFLFKLPLT